MAHRDVPRITDAPVAQADDIKRRMIHYSVQMGIRLVCLIAGLLVPGWPRWILFAAAVVLPYIAVVGANAGRERMEPADTERPDTAALPAGPGGAGTGEPGAADTTVPGIAADGPDAEEPRPDPGRSATPSPTPGPSPTRPPRPAPSTEPSRARRRWPRRRRDGGRS